MANVPTIGGSVAIAADPGGAGRPNAGMAEVLARLALLGGKPIETLSPEEARKQPTPTDAVMALLKDRGVPTAPDSSVTTIDRTIPGPGGPLPVRIYTPADGNGPFPVIVYYHGGGFVIATIDVYDGSARALSKQAQAVVVALEYRKAPEHKFPAAHEDAVAAYRWTLSNVRALNGLPGQVALVGESAGGNLAMATAMAARDSSLPLPSHILAIYPVAGSDTTTPSYRENAQAKPLNEAMMVWFVGHYIRTAADKDDPRLALLDANLEGLPPTTIITAEIDPLRSEGEQLAKRLEAQGVDVQIRNYTGVAHEFFGMGALLAEARDAVAFGVGRLARGFEGTEPAVPGKGR